MANFTPFRCYCDFLSVQISSFYLSTPEKIPAQNLLQLKGGLMISLVCVCVWVRV